MTITKTLTAQEVTLNCEISWPANIPYSKRFKRHYTMAVYDPGSVKIVTTTTGMDHDDDSDDTEGKDKPKGKDRK